MGVKWRDYLSRKGLTVETWMDANSITSVDGLRTRLGLLGITLQAEDIELLEGVLRTRASVVGQIQIPELQEEAADPVAVERPKRRKKLGASSEEPTP